MKASGQLHIPGRFMQGKEPRYPLNRRLVDRFWEKNHLFLPGFEPRTIQPVACRYIHHALPAPETYYTTSNKHESDSSYAGVYQSHFPPFQ